MGNIEIWKPIKNAEGYYEVSSQGNVRSVDRVVPHQTSGTLHLKSKLLTKTVGIGGYYYVTICINGIRKKRYCHEIECEAFYGPRPTGYHIDHKDKDRLNNELSNLSYKTVMENCSMPGSAHPRSILTEQNVREIRSKYKHRVYTCKMLGDEYGVDPTCIGHIVNRRLWKHI